MALSVSSCCRSLAPASVSARLSPVDGFPSTSGSSQRQFSVFNHCCSSAVELQSLFPNSLRTLPRGISERPSINHFTVCAATPDLAAGARKSIAPLTIRDAQIVAQPPQDKKIKIRVDIDGQATKRAFDTVLKDLAKHAPPIPGFRRAKGGKTSIVPLNVIYQFMGPKLVRKFVIDEILKATLQDYVEKEGIKVNNELKTDQSSEELNAMFEPGKVFGFDATLDLADEQTQDNEADVKVDQEETVKQTLEATA